MPTREHRRAADKGLDPRLLLLGAFLLGVLLTLAVAGALSTRSSETATDEVPKSGSTPTAGSAGSSAPATPPSPSGSPLAEDLQRALMTKPLAQLQPGDQVVYNMTACRFRDWVGDSIDVALIECPGEAEPFQTRTEYLVPVEPGGD